MLVFLIEVIERDAVFICIFFCSRATVSDELDIFAKIADFTLGVH